MAFSNARRLLGVGLSLSTLKLLTMQASVSRPRFRKLGAALLTPMTHNGEVAIRYTNHGRHYTVFIRMSDMVSDLFTIKELAVDCVYPIHPAFAPDLIIDGGGNIGLFSLHAAAVCPSAKIVICEPVPRSRAQIEKHLRLNGLNAEVLPVCLGGSRRTIPFYIREAIGSSFDPAKPYTDRMDVDVITLADVLQGRNAERILIKLDIEGMELEVLESYLPGEPRAVCVVGELHGRKANSPRLEKMFNASGWTLFFRDNSETDSIFEAWSPAASAILARAGITS